MKAWAEPHPSGPSGLYLIRGTAHPPGLPGRAESFSKVVLEAVDSEPILYAEAAGEILAIQEDMPAWMPVPPFPFMYFKTVTVLDPAGIEPPRQETRLVHYVGGEDDDPFPLAYFSADEQGHLLSHFLPPDPDGLPTLATYTVGGEWTFSLLPEDTEFGPLSSSEQGLVTVPSSGDPEKIYAKLKSEANPDPPWSTIEPPAGLPAGARVTNLSLGGDSLFAQFENDAGYVGLFRRKTDVWSPVPPPPTMFFTEEGELQTSAEPVQLDRITATREGDLYGLWQRDGIDMVYKFSADGGWSPMPPLPLYEYTGSGAAVKAGYVQDLEAIGATPGGQLVQQTGEGTPKIYGFHNDLLPPVLDEDGIPADVHLLAIGAIVVPAGYRVTSSY